MNIYSLYILVGNIAGKDRVSLIAPALEQVEIQSEIALTESLAATATRRAVEFIEVETQGLLRGAASLSEQRCLIVEHLLSQPLNG